MQRRVAAAAMALIFLGACRAGNPAGEGTSVVQDGGGQATATESDDAKLGTRANPVLPGQRVKVGPEWQVAIISVEVDANERVRKQNQFNSPPAEGHQFVMARFGVTYSGSESGTPWTDLSFKFIGSAGNTFSERCGVIPEALDDVGEMFPSASAEGNVCVSIPKDQIDKGMFIVEESFSVEPTRVFFAIA